MVYMQTGQRRGWFISLATFIANFYLLAFGLDALFSVADELFQLLAGTEILSAVRIYLAGFVVIATLPVLLLLVFVPHLPKRFILPPILLVMWFAAGAPPFAATVGGSLLGPSLIQFVLAILIFFMMKAHYGSWLIPTSQLPHRRYLNFGFVASVIGMVVFVPLIFGTFLVFGIPSTTEYQTRNYLDFTLSGIDIRERVYQKDTSQVRLIGMIHLGNDKQYRSLFEEWPQGALVLAEGVTDKQNLMEQESLSYDNAAESVGLVGQPVLVPTLDHDGNPISNGDNDQEKDIGISEDANGLVRVQPDVQYADVDMSDMSEDVVKFLKNVSYLFASPSLPELLSRWSEVSEELSTADTQAIMDEIIYVRNDHLMSVFDKQKSEFDVIIIPWGAMHMPDIEDRLMADGYKVASDRLLPLIQYGVIIKQLAGARADE